MRRPTQLSLSRGPLWVGVPALVGSIAALALPGTTSAASAEAAMLAVGALALLAGHTWGLLVVVSSHVPLVGRLWPALAHGHADLHGTGPASALAVVLVTALPALMLAGLLLPHVVETALPQGSPRTRGLVTAGLALALAASLILPAAL